MSAAMLEMIIQEMDARPDRDQTRQSRRDRYKIREEKRISSEMTEKIAEKRSENVRKSTESWTRKFSKIQKIPPFVPKSKNRRSSVKKKEKPVEQDGRRLEMKPDSAKTMRRKSDHRDRIDGEAEGEASTSEKKDGPNQLRARRKPNWQIEAARREVVEKAFREELRNRRYTEMERERERRMIGFAHYDPSTPSMPRRMRDRVKLAKLTVADPSLNPADISLFATENIPLALKTTIPPQNPPRVNPLQKGSERQETLQEEQPEELEQQPEPQNNDNLLNALDLDTPQFDVPFQTAPVEHSFIERMPHQINPESSGSANPTPGPSEPVRLEADVQLDEEEPLTGDLQLDEEEPLTGDLQLDEEEPLTGDPQLYDADEIDDFFLRLINDDEFQGDPVEAYLAGIADPARINDPLDTFL